MRQFLLKSLKLGLTISSKMLTNIAKLFKVGLKRHVIGRAIRLPLALVLLAALVVSRVDWASINGEGTPQAIAGLAEARDGDSLMIGRHRVRLNGIDAPERDQSCKRAGKSWACGREAQRHLARLIGNHKVDCTIVKRDRFDRFLAQCRAGQRDLNRIMVEDGMAISFGGNYRHEEASARRAKFGMWSGQFERPQQWRRSNPRR